MRGGVLEGIFIRRVVAPIIDVTEGASLKIAKFKYDSNWKSEILIKSVDLY